MGALPPDTQVQRLAWVTGPEGLLIATAAGSLWLDGPDDPARCVATGLGAAVALRSHARRWAAVSIDGHLHVGTVDAGLVADHPLPFVGPATLVLRDDVGIVVGDTPDGRLAVPFAPGDGALGRPIPLPARAAAFVGDDGRAGLIRSVAQGLERAPFAPDVFPPSDPTNHDLTALPGGVVGVSEQGGCVWDHAGRARSFAVRDVLAVDLTDDGEVLALGTRASPEWGRGSVALIQLSNRPRASGSLGPTVVGCLGDVRGVAWSVGPPRLLAVGGLGYRVFRVG
jgi:hypothetical protein